jgi:putative ABC transport system substrate-binding protein
MLKLVGVILAVVVVAVPRISQAQAAKVPHIGVLVVSEPAPTDPNVEAFRQGLRDLGYVEGQNVAVEYRYAHGRAERAPELVAELIGLKVDLIVASGPTALGAKNATQKIPIVFIATGDPVGHGIVASLARPGGNVTGLSLPVDAEFTGKWMELLKGAAPKISHIGYLYDGHMGLAPNRSALQAAADGLGFKLDVVEVRELPEIDRAFVEIGKERGGFVVPPSPFLFTNRSHITQLAAKHRVPAIYGFRGFADVGGLMSYGLNLPDVWRRAATYVDKVLKGAKPADLPVEQPTKFEFILNLKTAKALGLTIPSSLLLRADQIIE